jgi:hypothetical protein
LETDNLFTSDLENVHVLDTDEDIEKFIRKKISPNQIISIFGTYIIKHNIIGIDNINNDYFWKKIAAEANYLASKIDDYKYSPYIEKLISKGREKNPRIISIPTIKDRIILYVLKETLHRIFPECVQKQLVNIEIKRLVGIILNERSGEIIKVDLKGFYDSINQQILFDKIKQKTNSTLLLSLVEKAIINPTVPKKYNRIDKERYCQYLGIPQGLAISNILANIFLKDFDDKMVPYCKYYYRYVDDIILICDEDKQKEIYSKVNNELQRIGLNLNKEKTKIVEIHSEFDFLGYKIKNQTLSVRSESVQKHINSLYALLSYYKRLKEHKEMRDQWLTDDLLIHRIESEINETITGAISENKRYGWVFYFNAINDLPLLFKMNKTLNSALMRLFSCEFLAKLKVKSYVRAYYEIRGNHKSGYIENYDNYDTPLKKLDYLLFRGHFDKNRQYTNEEINNKFVAIREKNLSRMLRDIGSLS